MTKIVASGNVKIKVVRKPKKEKDILNEVENENWSPIHLCGCSGNSPIIHLCGCSGNSPIVHLCGCSGNDKEPEPPLHLCGCTAGQTDGSDDYYVNKQKRKK